MRSIPYLDSTRSIDTTVVSAITTQEDKHIKKEQKRVQRNKVSKSSMTIIRYFGRRKINNSRYVPQTKHTSFLDFSAL